MTRRAATDPFHFGNQVIDHGWFVGVMTGCLCVFPGIARQTETMLSFALAGTVSTAALAHRAAHTRGTFPTG